MLAKLSGRLGRNVFFVATIIVFGTPIIWLLLAPSKTRMQINGALSPMAFGSFDEVGIAAKNLFEYDNGIFGRWAWNSVWYTLVTVLIMLIVSVPAGYALAKFRFRFRTAILFTTLLLMLVPHAALILPLYLEMSAMKMTNTPWAVILPLSFYPFGVYMVYLYAKASVPDSILEAARIDGASEVGIFARMFVPLARPAIVMIGFFGLVGTWNSFFLPYVVLNKQGLATLQTGLQILVSATGAISGASQSTLPIHETEVALGAVISVLPILLVFLFAQKHLIAGQAQGAVKG